MGNELPDAATKPAAEGSLPTASSFHGPTSTYALRFLTDFSGAAALAKTKRRLPALPLHKALCHRHPPSPHSHVPLSDEASCLLTPGPSVLTPDLRLDPRCEEEIETIEHALHRCPPANTPRGPFPRPWISMRI